MKSYSLSTAIALLIAGVLLAPSARTQDKPDTKVAPATRFDQFKSLEGEWTGQSDGDHKTPDMKVVYHVTSGGSAISETIGPGTDHEMVTIITKDGDNVVLTHYCALGNQPHMKAAGTGSGNTVAFKFTSCGNMKADTETHMHNVTYTFVDKDTLKSEWTLYDKGKAAGNVTFLLKRKKA